MELFYNVNNPQASWSGLNDSDATSSRFRDGIVAYQIKAGVAATTGSQVTPSPDTGWIGLWVVTVPYCATSLTSSNIAQYTGSPILPNGIRQSILTSNLTYGIEGGTANTIRATLPIPVTTLTDGMDVWVKVKAANTGQSLSRRIQESSRPRPLSVPRTMRCKVVKLSRTVVPTSCTAPIFRRG